MYPLRSLTILAVVAPNIHGAWTPNPYIPAGAGDGCDPPLSADNDRIIPSQPDHRRIWIVRLDSGNRS